MKSTHKVRRVQLETAGNEEIFLLGLVSHEPDYKLSLAINRKLKLKLKNLEPVEIQDSYGNLMSFSRFSDHSASDGMIYNLISNRSGKSFLFKKLRNIDYILAVHDPEDRQLNASMASSLREIESVNAVFRIELDSLNDKNSHYLTI